MSGPPDSGKAKVFVYQPYRFVFTGAIHGVYIDGRLLGSDASGTFLVTEPDPSHHTFTVGSDLHDLDAVAEGMCRKAALPLSGYVSV